MKYKIIVWIGTDFTQYLMSYFLQNSLDCELYAIIDTTSKIKPYFENQTLVKFKKIWFYHDRINTQNLNPDLEYLKKFEETYNIKLWKLAINERIFYRFNDYHKFSRNEILSIEEQSCKLFEEIIAEIRPDFFITKETAFHHLELFYQMCLKSNIRVLMLNSPNLGKFAMITSKCRIPDFIKNYEKTSIKNRDFNELRTFLEKLETGRSIQNYLARHGGTKYDSFFAVSKFLKSDNSTERTNYPYYGRTKLDVVKNEFLSSQNRRKRKSFIDKKLIKDVNLKCKFVYFPLSVDMERNLLIAAPLFTNQIEILRYIVKSLPINYQLFVKENPSQSSRDWRSLEEYDEIISIPNLTLIHPSFSSRKLIENSDLVISIGGSPGLEAAFYEKPSITFSEIGYDILPSVFRVQNIDELSNTIKTALNTKVYSQDLDRYISLLENEIFSFDSFEFASDLKDELFLGGNLHDNEISEKQIKKIIKKHEILLKNLTNEHIKKINYDKKTKN